MQELINDLMIWAVTLTSFEQPIKLPTVEAVSHQQLLQTLCDDQFCTAVAYYDTETRTIFYDERMELQQDQSARGFIVHEMVHLYQMQNKGNSGSHNDLFWSFLPKVNFVGLAL